MASDNGYVKSETRDGIATITFHHPKSNSLPGHILRGLAEAVTNAGAAPSTRVIVLRSDGEKVFCAGASFDELTAIRDEAEGLAFFSGFAQVINAIRKAPVFVIGRIHGHTVGGGTGLACAVDVAYAHEGASARLSELAVGIGPFVVGPAVERKTGTGVFGLMSATPNTRRDARWCERHGIFAEILPSMEALDERVDAHARELAACGPEAMAELKRVLWRGTEDWDTLLLERAAISGRLVLSEFTRKAIAHFKAQIERARGMGPLSLLLFALSLPVWSCGSSGNEGVPPTEYATIADDGQRLDVDHVFRALMRKLPILTMPVRYELSAEDPEYITLLPEEQRFISGDPSTEAGTAVGVLPDTSQVIHMLWLAAADSWLPMVSTFTRTGKLIKVEGLVIGKCAPWEEPCFKCQETVVIDAGYHVLTTDTVTDCECDSTNTRIGPCHTYVEKMEGTITTKGTFMSPIERRGLELP